MAAFVIDQAMNAAPNRWVGINDTFFDISLGGPDFNTLEDDFDCDKFLANCDGEPWQTVPTTERWSEYAGDDEQAKQLDALGTLARTGDNLRPRLHSVQPQRPRIECNLCTRSFTAQRSLLRHIRSVHRSLGAEKYSCWQCDKVFNRQDLRARHESERHGKIELVECMRCGKKVRDRSLKFHLESNQCRAHPRNTEPEELPTLASSLVYTEMLAPILEQTEADRRLFNSFSHSDTCDPLSVSTYLSCMVTEGLEVLRSSRSLRLDPEYLLVHMLGLRGLAIRSIVRSLATGLLDDALHGAIRIFASTELLMHPDTYKVHSEAVKLLETQRSHRLDKVLSLSDSALEQWSLTAACTVQKLTETAFDTTTAIVPRSNTDILDVSRRSIIRLPRHLSPALPLEEPPGSRGNKMGGKQISKGQQPLRSRKKGKRKASDDAPNERPAKRTICPVEGCAAEIGQKSLSRHLESVHGQGETYKCQDCPKTFSRNDTRDRHYDTTHGDNAEKVECPKCGKFVCRRAMSDHLSRPICKQKNPA